MAMINTQFASRLQTAFYDIKHAISYNQHAVTRNRTLVAQSLDFALPAGAPDYGITASKCEIFFAK